MFLKPNQQTIIRFWTDQNMSSVTCKGFLLYQIAHICIIEYLRPKKEKNQPNIIQNNTIESKLKFSCSFFVHLWDELKIQGREGSSYFCQNSCVGVMLIGQKGGTLFWFLFFHNWPRGPGGPLLSPSPLPVCVSMI